MRARPVSRPVLSDEEIALALTAQGMDADAVKASLEDHEARRASVQAAYDAKTMRSPNDRHVIKQAQELQARLAADAEAASRERAKGDGPSAEEQKAAEMAGLAAREHKGRVWGDMPVLHLLNAAQKHGDAEMEAYAMWKREQR